MREGPTHTPRVPLWGRRGHRRRPLVGRGRGVREHAPRADGPRRSGRLLRLPLKPASCDYAFSVGVLHHLPDPSAGFVALAEAVRPGGAISVWVYGAENNGWIANLVSPLRRRLTSRLPPRLLHSLSFVVAVPLWLALVGLYRPARRAALSWAGSVLPYYSYLAYISGVPFREIHGIVHNHLAAPIAHYLPREVVEQWYRSIGARDA